MMTESDIGSTSSCSSYDDAAEKDPEQEALVISPSSSISEEDAEYIQQQQQLLLQLHEQDEDDYAEEEESVQKARRCRHMIMEGIRGGGGCTFALLYILLSLLLMSTMFNMREIVGDYLLGAKEEQRVEYREEIERAMDLRRRSPWIGQEIREDQEEQQQEQDSLDASVFYDQQGATGRDMAYLRHHRVPLVRAQDMDENNINSNGWN